MRSSTVSESRAAGARVIWSMVFVAAGLVLYLATYGDYYPLKISVIFVVGYALLCGGGLAAVLVNVVVFARVGGSRGVKFVKVESTVLPPGGRLVNEHGRNSLDVGRADLSSNEWRRLAVVLSGANWKWTRRLLEKTHIWEGLTKGGRYDLVSSEFERMEVVEIERHEHGGIKSVKITPEGIDKICHWARTPLL